MTNTQERRSLKYNPGYVKAKTDYIRYLAKQYPAPEPSEDDSPENDRQKLNQTATVIENLAAHVAELEARNDEWEQHVADLINASEQTCACGYDNPTDRCLVCLKAFKTKDTEIERLQDKVDGLECDLENAVETAFKRGAVKWARMNYPNHPCVTAIAHKED
ncbi:MAG: hypothetical protein GY807_24110 [Gammaproteobacteria bacterium]|nr:hypothetical protein [Gammaproteobacteria bacterium]